MSSHPAHVHNISGSFDGSTTPKRDASAPTWAGETPPPSPVSPLQTVDLAAVGSAPVPSYEMSSSSGIQSRNAHGHSHQEDHGHSHSGHGHSHGSSGHSDTSHVLGHNDDHGHGGHGHSHGGHGGHGHSHGQEAYMPPGMNYEADESRYKTYTAWQLMGMMLEDAEGKQLGGYLALRVLYTIAALCAGSLSDSVGLVCLAFHSLFECIGLGMELWAASAAKYQTSTVATYSYGFGRMEVLVGFGNAVFMIFVSIFTIEHALEALLEPPHVESGPVMTVAVAGFILNLIGLVVAQNTNKGSTKKQLVGEVLWIRLVADNLSCLGVMISAYLVSLEYYAADPVVACLISVTIMYSSVPLAQQTASILLLATPSHIKDQLYACVGKVNALDGVLGCSEQRFWTANAGRVVGSLKIRLRNDASEADVLHSTYQVFGSLISDLTVQLEKDDWSVHSGQQILEA